MNDQPAVPHAAPLPATYNDFLAARQGKVIRTINDDAETVILALYKDEELSPQFRKLQEATDDAEAENGACSIDNVFAAVMIQDKAKTMEVHSLAPPRKLAAVIKAMNVVMRRYNASRKQRKNMLAGQQVPPDQNGAAE
jgi:hypothetical protein